MRVDHRSGMAQTGSMQRDPGPTPAAPVQPSPERLIIIQADDLGIDDLGFSGNPLAWTPNLDRLAGGSVRALDFTVNPVCAPSRATLMTGRHFLRTGVSHVHGGKEYLHRSERTMGDAFLGAGWRTGLFGKWHSGRGDGYEPWQRGFEEAYAARLYHHRECAGHANGQSTRSREWADTVMVDRALEFLSRDPSRPALVYLSSMTPHTPLEAPQDWVQFHRQRGVPGNLAILQAMVSFLDAELGRFFHFLEQQGWMQNSLLLFTSDNGPAINRQELTDEERHLRKTGARRGWKGDLWENGVRAPLLVHWPAALPAGVVRTPLDQVDLLPTLLDWCGVAWPSDFPPQDGVNRRDLFSHGGAAAPTASEARIFNYSHPGWITSERPYDPVGIPGEYNPVHDEAKSTLNGLEQPISVRQGRFKYLLNPHPYGQEPAPSGVLIDLWEDPGETTDRSADYPEDADRLQRALLHWFAEVARSPHAFTAPVTRLSRSAETVIPGRVPCRVQGALQNTVRGLRGWTVAPALATYWVESEEPLLVTALLSWINPPPAGLRFSLQVGENRSQALPNDKGGIGFPSIALPRGTFLLTLALEWVEGGDAPGPGPELEAIRLQPLPVPVSPDGC